MQTASGTQESPCKEKAARRKERKAAKKRNKRQLQSSKKCTEQAGLLPPTASDVDPDIKKEQIDSPTNAVPITDPDSESEWEGFPDPPAPAAHISSPTSEADTVNFEDADNEDPDSEGDPDGNDFDDLPAIEGKNGISALQESIAHQFPGDPRPATHALRNLLDPELTKELGGVRGPSQPGLHTADHLAVATRLWFRKHRNKNVVMGIVFKNGDPVVDAAGDRRNAKILWVEFRGVSVPRQGQGLKVNSFLGLPIVPAKVREDSKKYLATGGWR
ncbi:hypothetical protein CH63R_10329 [Colletotrichum higginsianum IMI 349063]|uniref:Uncharacterized protein n=3 Tax=Colletotrichum higginsianum TaxID=80884 RepID=A0A1B7Y2H4_COLHI|nr:uncharacterized protein CH63R_10329 [Colletotrichum higginsianum IMI 349063]OBR06209.1 hypothetical protein CH63R_10329 [Colletotrichum higginsianum IMI 349063]TIC97943.1 hypothetical protein CH35J_007162 [Colletotrichum higginsianum]